MDYQVNFRVVLAGKDFEESSSNKLRLYKDGTEYTGNIEGSGDFSYDSNGIWNINVNDNDSGVFIVKSSTDSGVTYDEVDGLNPVPIILRDMLTLNGGTMEGDINMASNKIKNVSSISFTGASAKLHNIDVGNLLDKSSNETITGDFTFSGDNSIEGSLNITSASKLKINGGKLSDSLTASDLNMISGLYETGAKVLTTSKGVGSKSSDVLTSTTLTYNDAGVVIVDLSLNNVTLTLPALSYDNAGAMFVIVVKNSNKVLTIDSDNASEGICLTTGSGSQTRGSSVVLQNQGDYIILMCVGKPDSNPNWAVLSSYNSVIS